MNNDLRSGKNSRQAAAAKAIDRQSRSLNRQTPVQCRHPCKIHILSVGVDHIAEDTSAYIRWSKSRTSHRLACYRRCQLGRRYVLQCTAVLANCRSYRTQNHNFAVRQLYSSHMPDSVGKRGVREGLVTSRVIRVASPTGIGRTYTIASKPSTSRCPGTPSTRIAHSSSGLRADLRSTCSCKQTAAKNASHRHRSVPRR